LLVIGDRLTGAADQEHHKNSKSVFHRVSPIDSATIRQAEQFGANK
jgi:hypothetical protein